MDSVVLREEVSDDDDEIDRDSHELDIEEQFPIGKHTSVIDRYLPPPASPEVIEVPPGADPWTQPGGDPWKPDASLPEDDFHELRGSGFLAGHAFSEPQKTCYHSVKGQEVWGLIYDPGAADGIAGTQTLLEYLQAVGLASWQGPSSQRIGQVLQLLRH